MQLSDQDLATIREAAERFRIGAVYVFGSSLSDQGDPADIDLAVEHVPPGVFFKFYGSLLGCLSRPVDIVDLDGNNAVTKLIAKEAVRIFG